MKRLLALAEAGSIAIAPELLSGMGPNGGGTAELASNDANKKAQAAAWQRWKTLFGKR